MNDLKKMQVKWTVRHGYADEYNWIKTGEDTVETGTVVGYAYDGVSIKAIVLAYNSLFPMSLDDLIVVEGQ
jgi:hypothetical protein